MLPATHPHRRRHPPRLDLQAAGTAYYVTRRDGRVIFDNLEHTQEEAKLFWAMLRETGTGWSASGAGCGSLMVMATKPGARRAFRQSIESQTPLHRGRPGTSVGPAHGVPVVLALWVLARSVRADGLTVARCAQVMSRDKTFGAFLAGRADQDDAVGVVARNFVRFIDEGRTASPTMKLR